MKFMTKARQVCIYPPLLRKKTPFYIAQPAEPAAAEPAAITMLTESNFRVDEYDSKINAVIGCLSTRLYNGCGKIIFCHFTDEIDALALRLNAYEEISIAKFDGRVPRNKREAMLNTPVTVLIAQIKMCREGLNLQAHYSEVYFPSPDFNPAVESQAIARCWRIGQQKPVKVFRFMMNEPTDTAVAVPEMRAAYSMDTYSLQLQIKKREMIAEIEAIAGGSTPTPPGGSTPTPPYVAYP